MLFPIQAAIVLSSLFFANGRLVPKSTEKISTLEADMTPPVRITRALPVQSTPGSHESHQEKDKKSRSPRKSDEAIETAVKLVKKPIPKFEESDYEYDQSKIILHPRSHFSNDYEDDDFSVGDYDFDVSHDEFAARGKIQEPRPKVKNTPHSEQGEKTDRNRDDSPKNEDKPKNERPPRPSKESKPKTSEGSASSRNSYRKSRRADVIENIKYGNRTSEENTSKSGYNGMDSANKSFEDVSGAM